MKLAGPRGRNISQYTLYSYFHTFEGRRRWGSGDRLRRGGANNMMWELRGVGRRLYLVLVLGVQANQLIAGITHI